MKNFLFLFLTILLTIKSFSQCENDTIKPWFINFQNEPTISCSDDLLSVFPIAADNCDTLVDIPYVEEILDGDCPGNRTILRLYRAFDDSGNGVLATQIITLVDTVPPTIIGDVYIVVNSDQPIDTPFVTVTDNCTTPILTYTDNEVSGGNIIRIYNATDDCNNTSTFEQIININIVIPPGDEDEEDDSNNVAICHCTGNGNCHTIYVAQQAVQTHLNHGDYLGPCTEIIMDWQTVFPNSDLQMTVIKGKDNKYKKVVRIK
jgi:hypothetical protein